MFENIDQDPVRMFLTDAEIGDPKEEAEFFSSEAWANRPSLAEITLKAEEAIAQSDEHINMAEEHQDLAAEAIFAGKALVSMLRLQTELERRYEAQKEND
jgi:hypothetical protein